MAHASAMQSESRAASAGALSRPPSALDGRAAISARPPTQPASTKNAGTGRRPAANSAEGRNISAETNMNTARLESEKDQLRASLAAGEDIKVMRGLRRRSVD